MARAAKAYHQTLPHLTKDNWREHAAAKREQRDALIPTEWHLSPDALAAAGDNVTGVPASCGILSGKELEITELDEVEELAKRIADKTYTAVEVATAFSKRAAIAQQLTNCLTEIFFKKALERAKELDEILEKTGKTVGPLHGVPVSLKDQFDIAGTELTMGYVSYLGRISPRDSAIVALLRDAGAVFYCRTNVPQTLMIGDTNNHLFGRTHNPHNRKLSPGGSSGGEGALIAMKGSIIGVGTDIGGSVRIPSAMCGLHTIRPTTRRVPYGHATNSLLGQESVLSVAGPMAPYAASQKRGKLAFGIIRTDHNVTPTPPIKRALETAAKKLVDAGHEVIEFDSTLIKDAFELSNDFFAADGGEDFKRTLGTIEEPLIPGLSPTPEGLKTVWELWQLNRAKEEMQQAFLAQWLATAGQTSTGRPIDGLLCPPGPVTAVLPGNNRHAGYTGMFNLLDVPALCFPVTKVDPAVDLPDSNFKALDEEDQRFHDEYDAQLTAGVPAGVQLIGRRWQDEELLGLGEVVSDIVGSKHWAA
ncbi:putative amidase (putative) [Rhodotorula toruloides]|nr:putative amidase (putative) [Rhodotorula toruloides]